MAFRPPKKLFTDKKINGVRLVGFQVEELEYFVRLLDRLDDYKREIVSVGERALQNAGEANLKVEELSKRLSELNGEHANASSQITELNNNIGRLAAPHLSPLCPG